MFPRPVINDIKQHAIVEYPKESCGFVTSSGYVPCHNIAEDPTKSFRIDEQLLITTPGILAVVHSHPDGPEHPSGSDMRQQIASGLPWGIVACNSQAAAEPFFWGDSLPIAPLIGRDFRHGPSGTDNKGDCYSLVRDYYRLEHKRQMRDYPREWEWWLNNEDMYRQNFKAEGFVEIEPHELREGDSLIAMIRSKVPNHAAVYLGNGLILHHLERRLSRREPVGPWMKHIVYCVRPT